MRAAVFHDTQDIRVEEMPDPTLGPGDLLVRVGAVGICGTDAHEYAHGPVMFPIHTKHAVSGHQGPMVPGHELAGTVVAVGDGVTGFHEGSIIVSGAGISCGTCHWCKRGRTHLCQQYSTLGLHTHGGLAQFVAVPASTCIDVSPYGLTLDEAALGQPMSIAVHSMRRGRLEAGDVTVIIGVGGIGAFLTYAAAELGATVVVSDLDEDRLAIARSLGAAYTVNPKDGGSVADTLAANGLIPTVIYEVSGSKQGLAEAMALAPRGCRIVLVGLQGSPTEINPRDISIRELELLGTNAHAVAVDMPEALRLLASRAEGWRDIAPTALSLDALVSEGIEPMVEGRSTRIKTLIDPWADAPRDTVGR